MNESTAALGKMKSEAKDVNTPNSKALDSNTLDSNTSGPSRAQRKKQATRVSIIRAAEGLMRSQPIDEVTIQDITSAADIGHGTFYLHFKSKNEVLTPIVTQLAEKWDQVLQGNISTDDSAEILAFSSRHMARLIHADPLWHWYLEHSGVPVDDMRRAFGGFSARDFGKGLMSGRFNVPDVGAATRFTMGGYVSGLLASFGADDPATVIDNTVELLLRSVGIGAEEARDLAHRPLPKLRVSNVHL